jgi:hypothetical protein
VNRRACKAATSGRAGAPRAEDAVLAGTMVARGAVSFARIASPVTRAGATTGRGFTGVNRVVIISTMPRTLGYHLVKSAYGLWLPGDDRGSWSAAWDEQIGFYEPHQLHEADPVRHRMAAERMVHPPTRFSDAMIEAITQSLRDCAARSNGGLVISAFGIEPTHMHIALPYTGRDIDATAKWLADQTTKAVHRHTPHTGPLWAKGSWRSFVFDPAHWTAVEQYIRNHNIRRGLPPDIL